MANSWDYPSCCCGRLVRTLWLYHGKTQPADQHWIPFLVTKIHFIPNCFWQVFTHCWGGSDLQLSNHHPNAFCQFFLRWTHAVNSLDYTGDQTSDVLVYAGNQNSFRWKSRVFRFRSSSLGLVLERNAIISHATVSLTLTSTWSLCWLRSLLLNQEMSQIRPHRPHTPCSPPCWDYYSVLKGEVLKTSSELHFSGLRGRPPYFEQNQCCICCQFAQHCQPICVLSATEGSQLIGSEEKSIPCKLACDQIILTTEPDWTLPITNRFYRMFYCVGCFLMAGCIRNQFGDWQIPESKTGTASISICSIC